MVIFHIVIYVCLPEEKIIDQLGNCLSLPLKKKRQRAFPPVDVPRSWIGVVRLDRRLGIQPAGWWLSHPSEKWWSHLGLNREKLYIYHVFFSEIEWPIFDTIKEKWKFLAGEHSDNPIDTKRLVRIELPIQLIDLDISQKISNVGQLAAIATSRLDLMGGITTCWNILDLRTPRMESIEGESK